MFLFKWLGLQIFADGGAAAGGDGGAPAATGDSGDADAGHQRLLELGVPESKIRKNRAYSAPRPQTVADVQKPEEPAQEQAAAAKEEEHPADEGNQEETQQQAAKKPSFDELMQDPDYNSQMQQIIKSRLKKAGDAQSAMEALAPALEVLARKHGQDPFNPDYAALAKAISDDDEYYDDLAVQMGTNHETAKRLDQEQRQTKRDQIRQQQEAADVLEQQRRQEFSNRLRTQTEAFRKVVPGFDLDKEMQNASFARMVFTGVPIENAYYAMHHREMQAAAMRATASNVTRKISNAIAAGSMRPAENGTSAQAASVQTFDYRKASKEERNALKRRIREAAAQGRHLKIGE